MTSALESQCTLLIHDDGVQEDTDQLRRSLEDGKLPAKMDSLKRVISLQLNGEQLPGMLMMVIRYILPHENTQLRKLGLYYLEIVDKHGADGKMLPEMILVCNMVRNELVHPNEYTRGCALRFVCKIHDHEILEPLVPAIRQNLEHRHSFVRRNAVLAVHTIFEKFEFLIPDAPELVEEFLAQEGDLAAKRNAFIMLCQSDQDRAVKYLNTNIQYIVSWGETLQLSAMELVRRVCRANPMEKGHYIKIIFGLLNSPSAAVVYEAANTLISLSSAPTAIRAAAESYCTLLASQSEDNIKLILLDRITDLRKSQSGVLQELVMDLMRALSSPNMDIRKKTIGLVMDVVTRRNVDEVVGVLKKEVTRTHASDAIAEKESVSEYRQILIKAIHSAAVRFPEVATTAVNVLTDFLGDSYGSSAVDVISFVREMCELFPDLRSTILSKILVALPGIKNSVVVRGALWIMGSYSETPVDVKEAFESIMEGVGKLPLSTTAEPEEDEDGDEENKSEQVSTPRTQSSRPAVLADGTYATQIAETEVFSSGTSAVDKSGPSVRNLLLSGEYYVGVAICTALTKLVLRISSYENAPPALLNKVRSQAMLVCASILRFGRTKSSNVKIDDGSAERIISCIQTMSGHLNNNLWLEANRNAFGELVREKVKKKESAALEEARKEQTPVEELVDFRLLRSRRAATAADGDVDMDELALTSATTGSETSKGFQLSRVTQLTGMSDPVYAEAHVTVHQYDIILDVLVINTTNDTLQNLTLELATMGDLRLCERPQAHTLAPGGRKTIRANIKVASTETGIIFGNIVYDVSSRSSVESGCVILNDIHVDVMDYIEPGEVSDSAFRSMWAEFEWENKVEVNTSYKDLGKFLDFVLESTNMKCLTLRGIEDESGYLSANLYARSVFGEDALVNICVEKAQDDTLAGYIRIRSKTQGIALSLGDKITLKQTQKHAVKV